LLVLELGRVSYTQAWELQHSLVKARQEGRADDILVLLEHDPVITLGRSADARHVLASAKALQRLGIQVQRIERGGDVTYHGPGQLVGYPILHLASLHLGVSDYMRALEQVLLETLADLGLPAHRQAGVVGVWVGKAKIASLGARVERGVTYHGFALNVNTNLEHFELIVPCGLEGVSVTSMERELGRPVEMPLVRRSVIRKFGQVFGMRFSATTLGKLNLLQSSSSADGSRGASAR